MASLFDQLLQCEFRGVAFPCTHFKVHVTHDNVQHKHPDKNGARVEDTGLNPLTFEASIPFYNGVFPGVNEKWDILYPYQHRFFLQAMSLTTSGTLQHPSLGLILVKPVSVDSTLDASRQDGELVNASWIETRDEDGILGSSITSESPITLVILSALELDGRLNQTNFGGFDPDNGKISFEEALRRVAGAISKASILSRQQFGIIDRVIYRINAIRDAVIAAQDPQNWPLKESLTKLLASTQALKRAAKSAQKDVRIYITPRPMSLVDIGRKFGNKVGDMIRLNPLLASSPIVPERTVVRYYATVGFT